MTRLVNVASCKTSLDFQPDTPWPQGLPVYCFENELLCGFDHREGSAVELSGMTLQDAIKLIHPHLGFLELCRLSQKIPANVLSKASFWSLYGYHWKENLEILALLLTELPLSTQRWLQGKKMAPQDLAPLRSLPQLSVFAPWWPVLMNLPHSKSDLTQILELLVELILMEVPRETLIVGSESSYWIKNLRALRFPLSTSSDSLGDAKIRTIAWPLRSEARWTRKGDRSGVELKLFFSHPQELKRSLERLQQVSEDLQSNSNFEELWSKN